MSKVSIEVFNPFKGCSESRSIDIQDLVERENFQATKDFITDHLKFGLAEAKRLDDWSEYETTKCEYLITQLYQPNTMFQLVEKILQYQGILYKLKQYNEIINYLKGATNE